MIYNQLYQAVRTMIAENVEAIYLKISFQQRQQMGLKQKMKRRWEETLHRVHSVQTASSRKNQTA